jgi:poly(A) polymerase
LSEEARFRALLARPEVAALMALLNQDGAETRIVGGAVRNTLLGLPTTDIDFATTLRPEETLRRAEAAGFKVVPTGLVHGTVTVVVRGQPFEVTTLRRDVETDGRHATVAFTEDFAVDALRRDFTINQLMLDAAARVHDAAGGLPDLERRAVRFIGDPAERIREDYLRILRFFRFHAQYGHGPLDPEGLAAARALKDGMARLSAERIRAELFKLLVAPGAVACVAALVESGVFAVIAPCVMPDAEAFARAVAAMPEADAVARLAALALRGPGDVAALDGGMRLAAAERRRLQQAVAALAAWGDAPPTPRGYRLAGVRLGAAAVQDAAMTLAGRLKPADLAALLALPVPPNPFRGADVIGLGVTPGPAVGETLERALLLWADAGFPANKAEQDACLRRALPA